MHRSRPDNDHTLNAGQHTIRILQDDRIHFLLQPASESVDAIVTNPRPAPE